MFITFLLITALVLCVVHILFNYNKNARLIRRIPGPKGRFIVGNTFEFLLTPVELFKRGRRYCNTWKGIFGLWAYPFGFINLYNPEDIEVIVSTSKHNDKSFIYHFLRPWLRDGLLLSSGLKWQQRRKILTPTFHFNILRQFCLIMEENSSRLVQNLNSVLGENVDVVPILSEHTLNSICETAMGTRLSKESSKHRKSYKETIYKIGNTILQRFARTYLYWDFLFNLSSIGWNQKKYIATIHSFTKQVIKDRKSYINEHNLNLVDDENSEIYMKNKKKTAMLDLLISAEKEGSIDEEGIQEEVDTFMFEGHDTTSSGLTFLFMLLANNRHIQEKIVTELKDIIGDDLNKPLTIEDLSRMRYLECCIKEALRLYPPVHFISRTLSETTQLSNYTVPAGTTCFILIYDLHRRGDLFPNPLEYDPDRFLPENCLGRHPYAFIPFSAGPRNCIGQKFAMYEMKSTTAAILSNYVLLPVTRPSDIEIFPDLVLRNNGPVYVKFVKRKQAEDL